MTPMLIEREGLVSACAAASVDAASQDALLADLGRLSDPGVQSRLAEVVQRLAAYEPGADVELPAPPDDVPLLHAYAALCLVPEVIARQATTGIDPAVTRATLWDVGNQLRLFRQIHGHHGLDKAGWLSHHLADHLFALGRLQFQRSWFRWEGAAIRHGEPHLDVHIPEGGTLDPSACDDAFAHARRFFPQHFPDDRAGWFTCSSWLLDPRLTELLPGSNIARFQARFDVIHLDDGADARALEFVFGRPDLDREPDPKALSALPQHTRLQRALIRLYRAGDSIRSGFGIAPLER